jgi:hypothetical protein
VLTICYKLVIFIYISLQTRYAEFKEKEMYTVNNEGLLNNYAIEPPVYPAEYPSPNQQQRYALQGAIAALFVAFTVLTAIAVS